jgi:hypothetical protein
VTFRLRVTARAVADADEAYAWIADVYPEITPMAMMYNVGPAELIGVLCGGVYLTFLIMLLRGSTSSE